jgi:hypothetical protein
MPLRYSRGKSLRKVKAATFYPLCTPIYVLCFTDKTILHFHLLMSLPLHLPLALYNPLVATRSQSHKAGRTLKCAQYVETSYIWRNPTCCTSHKWTLGKHTLRTIGGVSFPLPRAARRCLIWICDLLYMTETRRTEAKAIGRSMQLHMHQPMIKRAGIATKWCTCTMTKTTCTPDITSSQK